MSHLQFSCLLVNTDCTQLIQLPSSLPLQQAEMAVRMHAVQGQTLTKQQLAPLKGPTGSADWPAVNNHQHCIPVSHHLPTHFTYLSQSLVFLYAYIYIVPVVMYYTTKHCS